MPRKSLVPWRWALFASAAICAACTAAEGRHATEANDFASEPGWGITWNLQGRLCFVDTDEDLLWCLDALGRPAAVVRGIHAHYLVLDPDGNLKGDDLVWDSSRSRWRQGAWQLSPQGKWSEVSPPAIEISLGIGLLVDRRGNHYALASADAGRSPASPEAVYGLARDGRITLIAGGGRPHRDGQGSAAGFEAARALRWGPDGALYAADGASVRRIALNGMVATVGRASPDEPGAPWPHLLGFDVTPGGVVAADHAGGRVLAFSPGGNVSVLFRSAPGWTPAGVATAADSLVILEVPTRGLMGLVRRMLGCHLRVQRLRAGEAHLLASVSSIDSPLIAFASLSAMLALGAAALRKRPQWPLFERYDTTPERLRKWLRKHVFTAAMWITLAIALVILPREMLRPGADSARLGIMALIVLVTAVCAQFGPGLLDRISKIGPIEMSERSLSLTEASDQLMGQEVVLEDGGLQGPALTPRGLFVYEQVDFLVTLVKYTAQDRLSGDDKQLYWRMLLHVGTAAVMRDDPLRAIARLQDLQQHSEGSYESARVAFTLGYAYRLAAAKEPEKKKQHLAKAEKSLRQVVDSRPNDYQAWCQLALVLYYLEDYGSAATANLAALKIRPQLALAKYNLAIALYKSDADKTAEAWTWLESIKPSNEGFEAVAKAAPSDPDLSYFRGEARFAKLPLASSSG